MSKQLFVVFPVSVMLWCGMHVHPVAAEDISSCMGCHWDIYEEWESSMHSMAWVDSLYQQAQQAEAQPEECIGCHAPANVLAAGVGLRPEARDENRETGVNCNTCHADLEETMHGPFDAESTGHFTEQDPLFVQQKAEALCLTCHGQAAVSGHSVRESFSARPADRQPYSCIDCHMPVVTRAHAEDPMGELDVPERPGRRHIFRGSHNQAMLAEALTVTITSDGNVRIENTGAGHGVPGGETKSLIAHIQVVDGSGAVLAEHLEKITHDRAIPPGQHWSGHFPVPAGTTTISVTLQYRYAEFQPAGDYLSIGTYTHAVK